MSLTIVVLILVLCLLGWFLSVIFEGEKPIIIIRPLPEFITGPQKFTLIVSDMKSGLRNLDVSLNREGRKINIFRMKFPFKGLLNSRGVHRFETELSVDPQRLNLAQGRVDLQVRVWDCSRRSGGDGNLSLVQHKLVVDTIPPAIRAVSRMHYINVGGTCLVVYQTSSDTVESGLFVNGLFFPGYPAGEDVQKGFHVCYFSVPHDTRPNPEIYLWSKDRAGNSSRASFYYHIRRTTFRRVKINITDRFLKRVLPHFGDFHLDPNANDIEKFLKINRDLRRENASFLYNLRTETSPKQLWDGPWLRLRNAATMARFLARRSYYYMGKKIDEQSHLGLDLASLANSEVQAANRGRVIFAGRLGIYGNTVVLDHGQGLASTYSHLSKINVAQGQEVVKGEAIGFTGQTGLAGGDHLHFGVMVSGVFVNPMQWWDSHWIRDNITRKLDLLKKQ